MALKEWREQVEEKEFWKAMALHLEKEIAEWRDGHDRKVYPSAFPIILGNMIRRSREAGALAAERHEMYSRLKDSIREAYAAEGIRIGKVNISGHYPDPTISIGLEVKGKVGRKRS